MVNLLFNTSTLAPRLMVLPTLLVYAFTGILNKPVTRLSSARFEKLVLDVYSELTLSKVGTDLL
ncbi:hypothetical protein D0C36_21245 [Mucilaginibacter conchicola]|uniref:GIT Spa2 homology (SHD) domain-containing protein n=1 Tax=Mucilaginibacter conchicola TaxID=2303333 RepID=A0A372NNQ1_9SPHI|nr:hypothetical protein D0C36_21245 [Mucilaginibacter conchicola]